MQQRSGRLKRRALATSIERRAICDLFRPSVHICCDGEAARPGGLGAKPCLAAAVPSAVDHNAHRAESTRRHSIRRVQRRTTTRVRGLARPLRPRQNPRLFSKEAVDGCVEINQCVGCTRQFFTKSFLGDDATVLAPSGGEGPASPRHRASVASMAWRTTRRFSTSAP